MKTSSITHREGMGPAKDYQVRVKEVEGKGDNEVCLGNKGDKKFKKNEDCKWDLVDVS